ncbi:MAG: DUF433 domain-containing protein [Acidimicrobiales bacterium]
MIERMDASILDRELYDESLAARTLGVPQSTLHWWLEGGVRRNRRYDPVLRSTPTGSRAVTWGEFVEARYLREYRRTLGVPLTGLRSFISYLRDELGVNYPLAYARPWVGPDRHLLVKAQEIAQLPTDLWPAIFEPHSGITMLLPEAEQFLTRVEFDDPVIGPVVRMFPAGKSSPVVIDPELRFGSPTVVGVPTEVLAEQVRAGDLIEAVAEDFDLSLDIVVAALNYENSMQLIAA